MMHEAGKGEARSANGRFAPGHSGNPNGRPEGSRHKASLAIDWLMEGEAERLARVAVDKAKDGDGTALRLCLDRVAPARKDRPVAFALPPIVTAEDAEKAGAAILAALAAGTLTPREASSVMALLVAHKGLIEAGDHERRLAAVEARIQTGAR
jgi:hypothetical protein